MKKSAFYYFIILFLFCFIANAEENESINNLFTKNNSTSIYKKLNNIFQNEATFPEIDAGIHAYSGRCFNKRDEVISGLFHWRTYTNGGIFPDTIKMILLTNPGNQKPVNEYDDYSIDQLIKRPELDEKNLKTARIKTDFLGNKTLMLDHQIVKHFDNFFIIKSTRTFYTEFLDDLVYDCTCIFFKKLENG